ncbi:MAG TPA: YdcH family protein [Vicinamibacterales bacterium]
MNAAGAQDVKHLLLHNNDQYRQLVEQHHRLDNRLHELTDKHYLSPTERIEEVDLKKRKLALKDRMEAITREYLQGNGRTS